MANNNQLNMDSIDSLLSPFTESGFLETVLNFEELEDTLQSISFEEIIIDFEELQPIEFEELQPIEFNSSMLEDYILL